MRNYESRKYNRVHNFSNPIDEERSKVKKETEKSLKYTREIEKTMKDYLGHNIDNDEILDKAEEFELIVKKESRNAKTHKKRIKKLQKEDKDFV